MGFGFNENRVRTFLFENPIRNLFDRKMSVGSCLKGRSEDGPFSIKEFLFIRKGRFSSKGEGGIIIGYEIIQGVGIVRPLILRGVFDVKK